MTVAVSPLGTRRKAVKKLGKRLFHGVLLRFLSRQSLIPDTPVIDESHFPWVEDVKKSWPTIRAELDGLLRHRAALPNFQDISPDQYRISTDDSWKMIILVDHKGVTKGLVRCHLALKVPKDSEKCHMTVGDQTFTWSEGETVFFDDTFPHEVTNETDEERSVLMIDVIRPITLRGRFVAWLMLKLLRRTGFFLDAQRNQQAWEAQYRKVLERHTA